MTSETTAEPIRLDQPLDLADDSGLVDIRGRIIRDGVVEAEAEGRVEQGETFAGKERGDGDRAWTDFSEVYEAWQPGTTPGKVLVGPLANCYWFETTMERLGRAAEQPPNRC